MAIAAPIDESVNLHLDGKTRELVIRRGEAARIHDPNKVRIVGDMGSVSSFINGRSQYVTDRSYVLADLEEGTIIYHEDPTDPFGAEVTGKLTEYPALAAWHLNKTSLMPLEKFASHIRMFRYYFTDKDAHTKLLIALTDFSIKIETQIDSNNNRRGVVDKKLLQEVQSSIPPNFNLHIPLFKNQAAIDFIVDILFDIYDNGLRFSLESVEFEEVRRGERQRILEAEIASLPDGLTVIYK